MPQDKLKEALLMREADNKRAEMPLPLGRIAKIAKPASSFVGDILTGPVDDYRPIDYIRQFTQLAKAKLMGKGMDMLSDKMEYPTPQKPSEFMAAPFDYLMMRDQKMMDAKPKSGTYKVAMRRSPDEE